MSKIQGIAALVAGALVGAAVGYGLDRALRAQGYWLVLGLVGFYAALLWWLARATTPPGASG